MLLLFDYDGVIVDSFALLLDLCVQAQKDLGRGREPSAADFQTMENLDFISLARLIGIPGKMTAAYSDRVFELQAASWSVQLFAGIDEVFHRLARNHTLGVITASQTAAVSASLQQFGLDKAVTVVLGGDSGGSKAERIRRAVQMFSVPLDETFMVGDAISDIREGKAAGVRTIAVSWGFQNRALLAAETPNVLIDRPEQLLDLAGRSGLASETNGS